MRMGEGREVFIINKNKQKIPVEISLNAISYKGTQQVLVSIIDITERKSIDKMKEEFIRKLKVSNQELNDFAYIASHDLKEPLRGIHNYSEFLLEDYSNNLDNEGKKMLQALPRLTKRLEELINTLLKYARLGNADLQIKHNHLEKILDGVINSVDSTLKEKNASVNIVNKLPVIKCDAILMGEIFYNLIINAVKYNEDDEPKIEIGCQQETNIIYVKDNGIGIKESHKNKIFKRLHGRDKYGDGTGAGLTIVKKMIEKHDGSIWFDSAEKEGTTFYFKIPQGD